MDIDLIQMHLRTARNEELCNGPSDQRDQQYGWTPLHAAVALGNLAKVKDLLKPEKENELSKTAKELLKTAEELLKMNWGLVNASSRDGWTPLHVAVGLSGADKKNDIGILNALLGADADCNARNKDGLTPLHVAAALHHDYAACVVKKLAEKVVFPDARDCKGRTALHIAAAKNKCPKVVSLLCEKEVLDAQDKAGDTPLHKAAAKTKNPEIVKLLLDKGADQWLKNGKEQLPFDLAKQNKKLERTEVYWRLHEATYSPRNLRREAILRNEKIDTLIKTVTEARKETRDDLHTLTERVETLNGNITRVGGEGS